MKLDEVLIRIRKLLARATSSNANEAAVAASMAASLIQDYQIDEAMIGDPLNPDNNKIYQITEETIYQGGKRFEQWRGILALGVADVSGTKAFHRGSELVMAGTETDIQMANYLFQMICRQLSDIGEDEYWCKYSRENKISWIRSFYVGAATTVRNRLWVEYKSKMEKVEKGEKSSALIVLRNKMVQVKKYMERYNLAKGKSGTPIRSESGYSAGVEAGRRVNIGNGKEKRGLGEGVKRLSA